MSRPPPVLMVEIMPAEPSEPRQGPEPTAVSPEPQPAPAAGANASQSPPEPTAGPVVSRPDYASMGIASHWDVHGEMLLSLVRQVLDGLIGDATRVVVVLEDADGAVRTFGDHRDPWGLFDRLVCSDGGEDDEAPPLGPGTRSKTLN